MSEDQNPPSHPPSLPPRPDVTGETKQPLTQAQQASKTAEILGSLHPSVLVTVMTLVGALGGSGLVVALGGATGEQLEAVEQSVEANEDRITRMEFDLERVRKQAETTESIKSDLGILKNDVKHMSAKVDEIYRLRGGN